MQNTRIFLHFSQVQVSSSSLWGCLPLVLVVPARVQPQHPLLVLKWPINCWPTFHEDTPTFRCAALTTAITLNFRLGWLRTRSSFGSFVRGGLIRWKSSLPQFAISKKEIYLYCTLSWLPGTSRWHLHSLVPPLPSSLCPSLSLCLPVFVSLIFWFISRFSLNDAKLPGH